MILIKMNFVVGHDRIRMPPHRFACVGIYIKSWKIGTRDIDPYPMSSFEQITSGEQVYLYPIYLAGIHKDSPLTAFPVASPNYGIPNVHMVSGRIVLTRRMNIHQPSSEVGIHGGG